MLNLIFGHINMRNTVLYFILILFVPATYSEAFSQKSKTDISSEKICLVTDRSLYIAGERLMFTAIFQSMDEADASSQRILFAEIMSSDGKSVAGSKFSVHDNTVSACIQIPDDLITGSYYIRVYTMKMRNLGPDFFSYAMIKIVNPLKEDVLSGSDSLPSFDNSHNDDGVFLFEIATNKPVYNTREQVFVDIKSLSDTCDWQQLILTVVPEHTISDNSVELQKLTRSDNKSTYSESAGISLTGKLIEEASGKPISDGIVNLSILGEGRDFMAIQTDTAGRFAFALPNYKGQRDLFLCAGNTSFSNPKILVDNDFCVSSISLPFVQFDLNDQERSVSLKMAVNKRIKELFTTDFIEELRENTINNKAFYGTPGDILYFDNYVLLPTLEESLNELPTPVRVKKRTSGKYFKLIGNRPEMAFFDPLVLVDLVAVNDPEKILAISPGNILKVEVINEPYVKGNITYGGIISIVSKRGDFAGLDLPASGIFVNYQFLSDDCNLIPLELNNDQHPDARNTLYWNPNLELKKNKSAEILFSTADSQGVYWVVLKAVDKKGPVYTRVISIEVK